MVKVEQKIGLAKYTTLGVGGDAEYFVKVYNKDGFVEAINYAEKNDLPITIIGGGSNLLISDKGVSGLVIVNKARNLHIIHDTVQVESGAMLIAVSKETVACGLSGLEWASGIPGTVGGAIIGNAGALGGQIADVLVSAEVYHNGTVKVWHCADFDFNYRYSKIKGEKGFFVLEALFKLRLGDSVNLQIIKGDKERRAKSFRGRTAGSYFKNPDNLYAADLIERAGLKGYRIGDAEVSTDHANVFRNMGEATAADFYKLEQKVKKVVFDKFGVTLNPEVVKLGEF